MNTVNFTDQLSRWWNEAEQGIAKAGDLVIGRHDDFYDVHTIAVDLPEQEDDLRILARAQKPAWHNAVAVIAHTTRAGERRPFALTHTEDVLDPYNTEWITREDLLDPVPLIEARITDDMVERASDVLEDHYGTHDNTHTAEAVIAAALGIEPA